ncbi:hypothetical protein PanWU01x14_167170, partial [Parasponia andersonii]
LVLLAQIEAQQLQEGGSSLTDLNSKKVLLQGKLRDGLYQLDLPFSATCRADSCGVSLTSKVVLGSSYDNNDLSTVQTSSSCHKNELCDIQFSIPFFVPKLANKSQPKNTFIMDLWHCRLGHPSIKVLK